MDDSKYLQVETRPHERSTQRKVDADVSLHSCKIGSIFKLTKSPQRGNLLLQSKSKVDR